MVAKRYEELICWQLAHELHLEVLAFTAILPASRDWKYCDQIRDSSSSGPSNMAEGFGRSQGRPRARLPGHFTVRTSDPARPPRRRRHNQSSRLPANLPQRRPLEPLAL